MHQTAVQSLTDRMCLCCILQDVHQTAMQSLTDWTAVSVELYYSIAQSMLLDQPCDVSLYAQKSATLARQVASSSHSRLQLLIQGGPKK